MRRHFAWKQKNVSFLKFAFILQFKIFQNFLLKNPLPTNKQSKDFYHFPNNTISRVCLWIENEKIAKPDRASFYFENKLDGHFTQISLVRIETILANIRDLCNTNEFSNNHFTTKQNKNNDLQKTCNQKFFLQIVWLPVICSFN